MSDGPSREMPRYRCHKEVWALKIAAIDGLTIIPEEDGYAQFDVSAEYMDRHRPQVGGYYVVYKDGYQSFSPAAPFEDGYTLIERPDPPDSHLASLEPGLPQ